MKHNPVMQRIGTLTRHWGTFTANPEARILRWCLKTDSARMLDAFLAWHTEEDSELADLFIVLPVPFEDSVTYAHQLVQHVADEFQAADEELKSMELPFGWLPAESTGQLESCQDLIATSVSLHMHFGGLVEHIALVMMPPVISNREEWMNWLNELASVSYWPSSVRVLVADWLPELRLNTWAADHSDVIVSQKPVLDIPGLAQEILAHVPGSGPGFDFRKLFVQMGAAASDGQLNQVRKVAEQALGIAKQQGWNSLGVAVQTVLAGALLAKGESDQSIKVYREARDLAMAAATDDPSRTSTIIISNFALSSGLVGQGKYDESQDEFASFESRRMASYCSEQLGDYRAALQEGQDAMRMLESIEPDDRLQSTAPHLALRLTEMALKPELVKEAHAIEQLCNSTLQGDWRAIANASMKA
jgi:tetratricopeptide (TPR) repeat protein